MIIVKIIIVIIKIIIIIIIIEVHFYTLYCCFSMDYLPFHFNENPKQTLTSKTIYHSPTLWSFVISAGGMGIYNN